MFYPHDTEYLIYDYDEHRYILTPKAVLDKLGTDLNVVLNKGKTINRQNLANFILNEISSSMYDEIYSYSNQNDIQEYILAKVPSARKMIADAMLEQVKYFMINGSLESYSGVDLRKNTISPDFSARFIAPKAKRVLSRTLPEVGVSIIYSGHFPILVCANYEKYGY